MSFESRSFRALLERYKERRVITMKKKKKKKRELKKHDTRFVFPANNTIDQNKIKIKSTVVTIDYYNRSISRCVDRVHVTS